MSSLRLKSPQKGAAAPGVHALTGIFDLRGRAPFGAGRRPAVGSSRATSVAVSLQVVRGGLPAREHSAAAPAAFVRADSAHRLKLLHQAGRTREPEA